MFDVDYNTRLMQMANIVNMSSGDVEANSSHGGLAVDAGRRRYGPPDQNTTPKTSQISSVTAGRNGGPIAPQGWGSVRSDRLRAARALARDRGTVTFGAQRGARQGGVEECSLLHDDRFEVSDGVRASSELGERTRLAYSDPVIRRSAVSFWADMRTTGGRLTDARQDVEGGFRQEIRREASTCENIGRDIDGDATSTMATERRQSNTRYRSNSPTASYGQCIWDLRDKSDVEDVCIDVGQQRFPIEADMFPKEGASIERRPCSDAGVQCTSGLPDEPHVEVARTDVQRKHHDVEANGTRERGTGIKNGHCNKDDAHDLLHAVVDANTKQIFYAVR